MINNFEHIPVMLNEVLSDLNIKPDGLYIDCTLGGGGHSEKILEKLSSNGTLIGIDKDNDALEFTTQRLSSKYANFKSFHTDFKQVNEVVDYLNIYGQIDGVLLDLGVSSHQIDTADRGFSFRFDGPLDMRMDKSQKLTAYDVVNTYSYEQLCKILWEYGEEDFAKSIAKNIIKAREVEPIKTTKQLSQIVESSMPAKIVFRRGGADKKTFQAIRIEVNDELGQLEIAVDEFCDVLAKDGKLCIITFHSLEDRIVKETFARRANPCTCPKEFPVCVCGKVADIEKVTGKPIIPSEEELEENPRSRSAKLRIAKKI